MTTTTETSGYALLPLKATPEMRAVCNESVTHINLFGAECDMEEATAAGLWEAMAKAALDTARPDTTEAGGMEAGRERVAQAICVASGLDPFFDYDPKGIARPQGQMVRWRDFLPHADAAITALATARPNESQSLDDARDKFLAAMGDEVVPTLPSQTAGVAEGRRLEIDALTAEVLSALALPHAGDRERIRDVIRARWDALCGPTQDEHIAGGIPGEGWSRRRLCDEFADALAVPPGPITEAMIEAACRAAEEVKFPGPNGQGSAGEPWEWYRWLIEPALKAALDRESRECAYDPDRGCPVQAQRDAAEARVAELEAEVQRLLAAMTGT